RHGSDRGDQLYRIRHTGGETQIRVPHHMVGNGWIYLGESYFNASANAGGGVSGYPREDENMRYWVRANLGQGQSSALYDGTGNDEQDSWSAPGKMSAEMNRQEGGDFF